MRIKWSSLDPTPTTDFNERRRGHYQRLAYVRAHFPSEKGPGWDKRGELLLRYGPPSIRRYHHAEVVPGEGLIPPKEVWIYSWLGTAYQLEDPDIEGEFRDAYEGALAEGVLTGRDGLAARDALVGDDPHQQFTHEEVYQDAQRDIEAEIAARKFDTLLRKGQVDYRERPQAYLHDYGGSKLEYVFDVVNFRGKGGKTRVEVNTACWARDLRYEETESGYSAFLTMVAVAKTMDYEEVTRASRVARDERSSLEDLKGRLVLGQLAFDLDPGAYRLAISVRDSLSRSIGIYRTETQVCSFPPAGLSLSDVQLALDVRSADDEELFRKGNLQVVPYPLGTFPKSRNIYLYFEIYGLEASPTGDTFYTVEFVIRPRTLKGGSWFGSSRGRVRPGVATAFEGMGKAGVVRDYIIFDPITFEDDVYDVEFTITDRVSDRQVSRLVSFGVRSD